MRDVEVEILKQGSPLSTETTKKITQNTEKFPFSESTEVFLENYQGSYTSLEKVKKISSAKQILRDLIQRYGQIFNSFHEEGLEEREVSQNKTLLNSSLLYLVASIDGNEDTIGHSQLVASYTRLLARALGFRDQKFLVNIERGALLHDIGKVGIPDKILRKAGSLTFMEREVVKEHPLLGYEIIQEFQFLKKAGQVILYHHESFDGTGYPYGLSGEEIPLEARIFAIADTLDAITSDRPYRKGKPFGVALREIEKNKATQFDPYIVDAFLSIPEESWHEIKAETQSSPFLSTVH